MPDTTATINARGLDKTGFDEALISHLFHGKVGRHVLALVELQVVDTHGPNIKGKSKVMLNISQIDPVTDDNLDEHVRELQRTLRYNRGLDGHTGTTTDGQEPTVEQVLAAGAKHRPHPFLPVDAGDDNPICDVCGGLEAAGVHSVQDTLDEPMQLHDDDPAYDGDQGDQDAEPWEYETPEGATADPFTTPTEEPAHT